MPDRFGFEINGLRYRLRYDALPWRDEPHALRYEGAAKGERILEII